LETGLLALLIYEYKILKIFQSPPGVGHSHGPWLLQDIITKRAGWFDIIVDNGEYQTGYNHCKSIKENSTNI